MKPKIHSLAHIVRTAYLQYQAGSFCINPIAESTFMCEDFVGRISRLSRRVSAKQHGKIFLSIHGRCAFSCRTWCIKRSKCALEVEGQRAGQGQSWIFTKFHNVHFSMKRPCLQQKWTSTIFFWMFQFTGIYILRVYIYISGNVWCSEVVAWRYQKNSEDVMPSRLALCLALGLLLPPDPSCCNHFCRVLHHEQPIFGNLLYAVCTILYKCTN